MFFWFGEKMVDGVVVEVFLVIFGGVVLATHVDVIRCRSRSRGMECVVVAEGPNFSFTHFQIFTCRDGIEKKTDKW